LGVEVARRAETAEASGHSRVDERRRLRHPAHPVKARRRIHRAPRTSPPRPRSAIRDASRWWRVGRRDPPPAGCSSPSAPRPAVRRWPARRQGFSRASDGRSAL